MALDNYRDLSDRSKSLSAGFQFEFACSHCKTAWRSPYRPFRTGQLTGVLLRASHYIRKLSVVGQVGADLAEYATDKAHAEALQDAMVLARQRYTECPKCQHAYCDNCMDGSVCVPCMGSALDHAPRAGSEASAASATCPQCQAAAAGGRFCAECGFDFAATHKSCPGCGALCQRQSRFCTDCGHSF